MSQSKWNVDVSHSAITFSVRHMMIAKVRGRLGAWTASIHMDEDDALKSKVEVEIEARSIDTNAADRDKHLRSADFLDVEKFPKLTFRSTKIEKQGKSEYTIHGELTIRDQTQPVVLTTEQSGPTKDPWGNARMAFTAATSINRSDFGLTWNQALETGGMLVGDRIDIDIEVQAVKDTK